MSWVCEVTEDAERELRELPKAIQKRVARVLAQMENEPFQRNVKSLHGEEWKGVFRRRIGDYRLLFLANHEKQTITVLRVLLRSGKTYR
jgi:mRNA-degrading endonuclease RelE of RelBE toxin-antitoxin system